MAKYKDKVSEAAEELSKSIREANEAMAGIAVAAQERNVMFVQSFFENEVELLQSHAEGTRTMMEKLAGESEKGPALFQTVVESAGAAQDRNLQFFQNFLENGTEVLMYHVDDIRSLTQMFIEQSRKSQEAFGVLAREAWDANRSFFSSPFSYYEKAMETAESIVRQGVDTAQKMTHHESQAVHSATKH